MNQSEIRNYDNIRIIALDLDGTLLNEKKELTAGTYGELERLAGQGVEIVPTTGRFYDAMPEVVKTLPFIHYAITCNGATVYDIRSGCSVDVVEIPAQDAAGLTEYLDQYPVIYDCYLDGKAWMEAGMLARIGDCLSDGYFKDMVCSLRRPVPDLRRFILESGKNVQKMLAFTKDQELRHRLIKELGDSFPELAVSSSYYQNIEINHRDANKGHALHTLAGHLGVDIADTMAFGDGLNDIPMIQEAGVGVGMKNAEPEVLEIADFITDDNDHEGVAAVLRRTNLQRPN